MMVYEACHTTCTKKTVILVMSTFVSSGRFYDGVCVYHLFSLMCCILCVCLRPVFCVPGVVTVSGLSLRSSSSVLCARRCHCIWIVPSVFPSVYSMYCLADKWCQWHENDTFHIKCYDCIYDREMTCNMISLSTKHKNNL